MFCTVFSKGDKYDKSVEAYIKASPSTVFMVKKTGNGFTVSAPVEVVPVIEEKKETKPKPKETQDAVREVQTSRSGERKKGSRRRNTRSGQ